MRREGEGHWRPSPGCTEIPHSVTKTAVYSSCRGAAAHRTRVHRPALSLHAGRVCPALSLAAGKPRAAQILPSRGCREDGGCQGAAGPHAPGSTSSRGSCARGVSCVAWQGGSRPVRLSASTGRACGALTCPGSPPGTCGDRDGAEPPPQHPSSFPAPATAAHHSPRAATASFRTSLFLSSRGLASARITLAL